MGSRLGVCVAFFSPCDYALPRQHFQRIMQMLEKSPVDVSVAQVVQPGQSPELVPASFASQVFESTDVMFFKENLWNLAAQRLDSDKLLFMDSDVLFRPDGWPRIISDALDRYDVIQPFATAEWLGPDGQVFMTLPPAAHEIQHGRCPVLANHHPGFAWAMTRSAFDRLGGWYDFFTSGAGDAAFAFSLCPSADPELGARAKRGMMMSAQPSYVSYRQNALSLGLSVGIARGVLVRHNWHGDRNNRGYLTRETYFPAPLPGDAQIRRRPDGLLEWAVPAPFALDYFVMRQEDGAMTSSHERAIPHLSVPPGRGESVVPEEPDSPARGGRI